MTAMIRIAPIAITAQSRAGGMELLLVLGWVIVNDVTGWVMVNVVAGGCVTVIA